MPKAVQSPVCLSLSLAKIVDDAVPLRFEGHWENQGKAKLTNNSQSAVLTLSHRPVQPRITGGPLRGVYVFEQLHFHWGPNDSHGCEHLLDGIAHAMEIHLVHYNAKYGSFGEAMNKTDGLVVVAFLVRAQGTVDCADFQRIACGLPHILLPGSVTHVAPDCMRWLTAQDLSRHYYSYQGSLTTAPYFASVTWIVYLTPLYVSHRQSAAFRKLRTNAGKCDAGSKPTATATRMIESNFRPVQSSSANVTFTRNTSRHMRSKL
uniref:Alpha-carbonic anhydrase domain-containing protein n=1 Tax=Anopheles atroparvus TaxID=41427 RepID=A0A182ITV0_ANOAO